MKIQFLPSREWLARRSLGRAEARPYLYLLQKT